MKDYLKPLNEPLHPAAVKCNEQYIKNLREKAEREIIQLLSKLEQK